MNCRAPAGSFRIPRNSSTTSWPVFTADRKDSLATFHLPRRRERNGPPPSAEAIHRWSARHPSVEGLQNWYSPLVGTLPLLAATVVCQRTNGYWNGTMRERYANTIQAGVVVLIIAVIAVTLSVGISWPTSFAAAGLSLPLLRWVLKEITQQREASAASRRVVERADGLWRKILEGADSASDSVQQQVRELQNDILDQRRRDPMVFGWVYSWRRTADEETMRVGAECLITEYSTRCR